MVQSKHVLTVWPAVRFEAVESRRPAAPAVKTLDQLVRAKGLVCRFSTRLTTHTSGGNCAIGVFDGGYAATVSIPPSDYHNILESECHSNEILCGAKSASVYPTSSCGFL